MPKLKTILFLSLICFQALQAKQAQQALPTDSLIVQAFELANNRDSLKAKEFTTIISSRSRNERQNFRLNVIEAFILLRGNNLPEALITFKETLKANADLRDPLFFGHLNYGLGIAYTVIENREQAKLYYDEAIKNYERAEDWLWANEVAAEYGLGVMFRSNYLEGAKYLTRALEYVITLDTTQARIQQELPQLFMNLALANRGLGEPQLAIDYAERAIAYGHRTSHRNVPSFYATLGAIYRSMEEYDTALKAYKKSLAIAQNRNMERSIRLALSNIANVFSIKGKLDSAIHYLRNADKINEISDFHLQNFNVDLARYYHQINRSDSAIYFAERAIAYGDEISNFRILRDGYQLLAEVYDDQKQPEKALAYERLFKIASDSIMLQVSAREYDQLKVRLQTMDQEYELAALNDEISTQRTLNVYLILLIAVSAIAVFFIIMYWRNERKRKNMEINNILVSKKSVEANLLHSQQELADTSVRMLAQNQFLEELEHTVKESAQTNKSIDVGTALQIDKAIRLNKANTNDWDTFITNFGSAHADFFQKLKSAFPNLTSGELKHCALLRMNISVKQAAHLLAVDQKSVTQARYRLKKKMKLTEGESIHEAIYRF